MFEENGEIISRETIENSIDHGIAYRIREEGRIVGGLVLKINEKTQHNELELLFVNPEVHSKGGEVMPHGRRWKTSGKNGKLRGYYSRPDCR